MGFESPGSTPRALRRYVLEDERIVLATRHHWARLIEPVLTAVLAFVVVAALVELARAGVGESGDWLWALWLVAVARAVIRLVGWHVEWFVATDKRMLLLTGLITQRVAMMPLHKVTDMSYTRSVLGRAMGFGEFVLESAGQDQAMRHITYVPSPDRSYRTLCATIFAPGTPLAPAVGRTPPVTTRPATTGSPATGAPPVIRPVAPPPRPERTAVSTPVGPLPVTQTIPVVASPAVDPVADRARGAAPGGSDPDAPGSGT